MASKTLKHEEIKEKLLGEVTQLPVGTRFPTVKEIMNRYNVSQATVGRALQYLKENGYVEATVGRGIFTRARMVSTPASLRRVDLFFFGLQDSLITPNFHTELTEHLSRKLGERSAWLRTTVLPHKATVQEMIGRLDTLKPESLLLVNLYSADIYEVVRRRGIPFVLLFPNCPGKLTNSLLIDNRTVVRNWLDHLFGLGHRRIAYLHGSEERYCLRDQRQRVQFFYEEMCRSGIIPDPRIIRYGGFTVQEGYQSTREILKGGMQFSAIITADLCAPGVYDALHEQGLQPGRDISVVGTDDCLGAQYMKPPLTTVRIPRGRVAEMAIERLEHLVTHNQHLFDDLQIGSDLVVRQSTHKVNVNH